jgi:hypothetical protein
MRKQQYGVAERETGEVSEELRVSHPEKLRSPCLSTLQAELYP